MAFTSLDGVVQAPGGPDEDRDGGFAHGGWAVPYFDERLIARVGDLCASADALLLGRRTYDIFAAAWPLADDPIAARLNAMTKHVASRSPLRSEWRGATRIEGDVVAAVRGFEGETQVHGSDGLVRTLLEHDLVDELRLLVFPVVLGSGKRLFADSAAPAAFTPVDVSTTDRGVVLATCARAGTVGHGALGPETGNW